MKITAKPNNRKFHLTVGDTTYALEREAALRLSMQLAEAVEDPQWGAYLDELTKLQDKLFNHKPGGRR